jgi:Zn-dependent protease with chaperone function
MSLMLLSHVLASLCLYISSKAMHSYIPNPCGTPSVSYASLFQVVSSSDIISKWLISMWCQQGREESSPGGMQWSKDYKWYLQVVM